MKGDVVVFDPDAVRANATFDEPRQYPDGISHVLVNGTLVVERGVHTGALPGQGPALAVVAVRQGGDTSTDG